MYQTIMTKRTLADLTILEESAEIIIILYGQNVDGLNLRLRLSDLLELFLW